jgi:hypothetical protein
VEEMEVEIDGIVVGIFSIAGSKEEETQRRGHTKEKYRNIIISSTMTSLKPMEIKTSHEADTQGKEMRLFWRYKYYFGILLVPLYLFFSIFVGNFGLGKKSNKVCHQECSVRRNQRYEHFKGRDILNTEDLLNQVADETKLLVEKLQVDYGKETFKTIFMNDDGKVRPFVPFGDESTERLKRKLMIKVLSAQKDLMQKESVFNGCDCVNGDVGIPRNPSTETKKWKSSVEEDDDEHTLFENYIWATGGHSASAGHGNLFNESYTAFMERDLKDVFGSIGIDFQGRK